MPEPSYVAKLAKVSLSIISLTKRPNHYRYSSSPSTHKSPQANSPATSPVPATGAIKPAAPELGDDAAPLLVLVADSFKLPISWALTPVPFLHWSSLSSCAVVLKTMSAHCNHS
jgi:hypothetical protein